jgi:anti-sigma factor RsiW
MWMKMTKACRKYRADIIEWIDGSLSGEARRSFEAHVASCPGCREVLRSHERIHHMTCEACHSTVLRASVAPEVVEMTRSRPVGGHSGVAFYWAGAGAAVAAVALAIVLLWNPSSPSPQPGATSVGTGPSVAQGESLSLEMCAREHARASVVFAPADRATWSLALAESNLDLEEQ